MNPTSSATPAPPTNPKPTPLTDAEKGYVSIGGLFVKDDSSEVFTPVVPLDFARSLETRCAELEAERDEAVGARNSAEAFAHIVERGEARFAKAVDAQLIAISKMPLGKTADEGISDAVARVLADRDAARAILNGCSKHGNYNGMECIGCLTADRDRLTASHAALVEALRNISDWCEAAVTDIAVNEKVAEGFDQIKERADAALALATATQSGKEAK